MTETRNEQSSKEFLQAAQTGESGLIGEFFGFMKDNAKWWLLPFLIVFGVLGLALVLGGTGAAPFIYTMF
jgi:hypothetical protein